MRQFTYPTVGLYTVWFSEMLRHAALPLRGDFRVCDIGCGLGYHCFQLEREVAEVHGFDISQETIGWLRQYPHRVSFEILDICDGPPVYPSYFDRVFSSDVYEHVDRPMQMLENIHHILRPGGSLVITFPNHRHHGHNQVDTAGQLQEVFGEAGFRACQVDVVMRPGDAYTRWLDGFSHLRFWSDRFNKSNSRQRTEETDRFHETAGFSKSQHLARIPLLAPSLNMLLTLFARSTRRYPIYEAEPEGADVREKRILVVAQK